MTYDDQKAKVPGHKTQFDTCLARDALKVRQHLMESHQSLIPP